MTHKAHAINSLFSQNVYFPGKTEREHHELATQPPAQMCGF